MADPGNTIFVSVVTHWEIAAKQHRHAAFDLREPLGATMERHGFIPLDLTFDAPTELQRMPGLHGDPFDRMLVAQALHHKWLWSPTTV